MIETKFEEFPKIPRLYRNIIITEKIDGTNASVFVPEDNSPLLAGSRSRWITPGKQTDNAGFAQWVYDHSDELRQLGPGHHFGEWWGGSIQRGYGLKEKRFSLFNTTRWAESHPACVSLVPVLYSGPFSDTAIQTALDDLRQNGSKAVPFMNPEGIVVFHEASRQLFKITLDNDAQPKGFVG